MRVRFWGTRGSLAKPGPTTLRYGGNTSCVSLESNGGTLVVIDAGTGAQGLGHAILAPHSHNLQSWLVDLRTPDEILLSEIVSAVDGPITLGDFGEPHADGACDHEGQCVLLAIWKQAGEVMRNHLEGFTLASIASVARGDAAWPANP